MSAAEIVGRYARVDGNRTFYDECGEGTPVVCVHTAGADSREYQYLLPLLAGRGYRGLALDLPGHSRSYPVDWEPHRTINQHAEYVHRFAQTVCGGEKPVMIGCSIGGCIAFDLAANHSEDFLAIVPMEGLAWGSPILPFPGELERPAWSTAWKPFLEFAAVESLGKPTLADPLKVKELWWQHQNCQQAGNGDIQGWAQHDVRGPRRRPLPGPDHQRRRRLLGAARPDRILGRADRRERRGPRPPRHRPLPDVRGPGGPGGAGRRLRQNENQHGGVACLVP